jgi:hypothetical protein
MNPLMRLTGFTQGSVASGPTSFANFLRTQAKLVQAVVDDLIPAAVNWPDIVGDEATLSNNSAQITGINDSIGIRLTWTPERAVFFAKTSASALAANDVVNNPSGWKQITNGEVIFVSNNTHVGFATTDSSIAATVRNADGANASLDSFAYLLVGGA